MSRTGVSLRPATAGDVPFLVELWGEALRRTDRQDQVADLELIVKEAAKSAEQRVVVAELDGQPAGAVLLRVGTLSPLNLEPAVQALAPVVATSYRRHGIGRTLMEAAVGWAEELGIGHVMTAAQSSSRNGNRFMARLSLGPQATLRVAPTHAVRAKLTAQLPASRRVTERVSGRRHLGQVLAARRQLRDRPQTGSAGDHA